MRQGRASRAPLLVFRKNRWGTSDSVRLVLGGGLRSGRAAVAGPDQAEPLGFLPLLFRMLAEAVVLGAQHFRVLEVRPHQGGHDPSQVDQIPIGRPGAGVGHAREQLVDLGQLVAERLRDLGPVTLWRLAGWEDGGGSAQSPGVLPGLRAPAKNVDAHSPHDQHRVVPKVGLEHCPSLSVNTPVHRDWNKLSRKLDVCLC